MTGTGQSELSPGKGSKDSRDLMVLWDSWIQVFPSFSLRKGSYRSDWS